MAGRETSLTSNIRTCHLEGEKHVRETSLLSKISPCHLEREKHVRETSLLSNIRHRNGERITGKVC
jgi:hypothetical protein